jgi:hydroxyacylglutathione hydrolase
MYLLLGSERALLIDSGDVADAGRMPLAATVLALLPIQGSVRLPLLVAHTHRHFDHRAGDAQFAHLPDVTVVPPALIDVQRYFGFGNGEWGNGGRANGGPLRPPR